MEQTYMKEKPILPLLLSMAAPMILSMLVNSLYNILNWKYKRKCSHGIFADLGNENTVNDVIQ